MDYSTIQKKLFGREYTDAGQMLLDMKLVLENCFMFNQPGDWVYEQGKLLNGYIDIEWNGMILAYRKRREQKMNPVIKVPIAKIEPIKIPMIKLSHFKDAPQSASTASTPVRVVIKAPVQPVQVMANPQLSQNQIQKGQILEMIELLEDFPSAAIFLKPVSPQLYPDYHLKIKNPIDIETMKMKVNGDYNGLAFETDMRLLIQNCYRFNQKGKSLYIIILSLIRYGWIWIGFGCRQVFQEGMEAYPTRKRR